MKFKIIVMMLIIVGFSTNIISQNQQSAFKIPPEFSQGFIVLNEIDSVESWSIEIENRTLLNRNNLDPSTSINTSLIGLNYFKMPDNYDVENQSMIISVKGYSAENILLISDNTNIQNNDVINPACYPCPNAKYEQCAWICNGNGYAFEIVSYASDNISSPYLQLEKTTDENGVPFYNYMTQAQFFFQCSNSSCNIDGINNIKIENPTVDYRTVQNNVIEGTVYGIAKGLGPWAGSIVSTGTLGGLNSPGCGQNINWAITQINTASGPDGIPNRISHYGMPNLECLPAYQPTGNSVGNYDAECINNIDFLLGENNDGDIFDYLDELESCYGGSYIQWWENISEISISNISNPNGIVADPITIISEQLFDLDGSFKGPNINLSPGLYTIATTSSSDGYYFPVIKEVQDSLNSNVELSSFFTANIYPNPVIKDDFNVEINVAATLKIKFILTTINGVPLVDRNFIIDKGQTHIVNIGMDDNSSLPTGTLVGTFIFEDNSSKSYNIIKY